MARTYPWKVSEELWEKVKPLIPAAPSHAKGGRPRMPDRKAFEAMVYVLRTGIQWNALPRELGASSTVHDRFQEWERQGFFKALWQAGLETYDELQGIEWEWQSVDGAMRHLPLSAAPRPAPIPLIAASREPSAVCSQMEQASRWPWRWMGPIAMISNCSSRRWMAS